MTVTGTQRKMEEDEVLCRATDRRQLGDWISLQYV